MPSNSTSQCGEDAIFDKLSSQLETAKQRAEEERTLPAFPLSYTNPLFLIMQFAAQRKDFDKKKNSNQFQTRTTYIRHEAHFSSTPLKELNSVLLRDMKVRQRAKGKYILCRIIAPSCRLIATTLAIEDSQGWNQIISLYNYPGTYSATIQELDTMFPINSVIAIREPLVKMSLVASHSHIRVDSPTDLIILESGDPILANIKLPGDKHFKVKQYYASIAAYSLALLRKPSLLAARLNRSLANLRVERNLAAVEDAQAALSCKDISPPDRSKALYRCAQGMYGEGDYTSAKSWYSKCLAVGESLEEAASGIKKCDARIKEQTSGMYDWYALHEWVQGPYTRADVADYIGPVEKATIQHRGGGRGVVASRDIAAGELLVFAKPFASATPENFTPQGILFGVNILTNQLQDESRYVVIQRTIERMASSRQDAKVVLDLYAGPNHSKHQESSSEHQASTPLYLDSARVQAICSFNVFGGDAPSEQPELRMSAAMLYTFPSYFNHSCISNAERNMIGDLMFIRAVKRINAKEEVTLSYCGHGAPYERRAKVLKTWFPKCDCPLFQQDRHDGESNRLARQKIVHSVKNTKLDIPKLRVLAKEIDKTYKPGYGSYKASASAVHRALADALEREAIRLRRNGRTDDYVWRLIKEAIQEGFITLEMEGVHIVNNSLDTLSANKKALVPVASHSLPYHVQLCVRLCFAMVGRFHFLNDMNGAERWMRAAVWIDTICTGGGIKLFKVRHAKNLALMGEEAATLLAKIESSA